MKRLKAPWAKGIPRRKFEVGDVVFRAGARNSITGYCIESSGAPQWRYYMTPDNYVASESELKHAHEYVREELERVEREGIDIEPEDG